MKSERKTTENLDLAHDDAVEKPKRFRKTKKFLLFLLFLIVARLAYFYALDKPLATNVDAMKIAEPDSDLPDASFVENFDARQTTDLLPAEENGWREILQALGPKCLEQQQIADSVPWDEIATNKISKDWFQTYWTPICEKFELDPNAKPTAYDRLTLHGYLIKNGVVGNETVDEEEKTKSDFEYWYWENGEKKLGILGNEKVGETYVRLLNEPWTEEEFPRVADWIRENDDLYALFYNAARKPKFGAWRFMSDNPFEMLLPAVQYEREIARLLSVKANGAIGEGNVSQALDAAETAHLIAEKKFARDELCLVESLVAIASDGIAFAVPYGDNPNSPPTEEDCRRAVEFAARARANLNVKHTFDNAMRTEKEFCANALRYVLNLRRETGAPFGAAISAATFADNNADPLKKRPWLAQSLKWTRPLWATPFNDEKALKKFDKIWDEYESDDFDDGSGSSDRLSKLERIWGNTGFHLAEMLTYVFANDENSVYYFTDQTLPASGAAKKAFQRMACVSKISQIAAALLEYQAVNGHLPPAFSVDANGAPLLSWRVLILPYLGEDEKALYEKLALDEPWYSEHNKSLLATAPEVFRCDAGKFDDPAQTGYAVLVGNDAFFDASGVGKDLRSFTTDADVKPLRRALVVECDAPAHWAAPDSNLSLDQLRARFDANKPLCADGCLAQNRHAGGAQLATANGAVAFFATTHCRDKDSQRILYGKATIDEKDAQVDAFAPADALTPSASDATTDASEAPETKETDDVVEPTESQEAPTSDEINELEEPNETSEAPTSEEVGEAAETIETPEE